MTTSVMRGAFLKDHSLRREFLSLITPEVLTAQGSVNATRAIGFSGGARPAGANIMGELAFQRIRRSCPPR